MNTKRTIAAIMLIFLGFSAFAGNGESLLSKQIHKRVMYPSLSSGEKVELEVVAKVSVNDLGHVVVENIQSANEEVNASIRKQLERISLPPDKTFNGKTFSYRFLLEVQ